MVDRVWRAVVRKERGIEQSVLSEIRVRYWLVWKAIAVSQAVESVQRVPNRIMTYSTELEEITPQMYKPLKCITL